VRLLFGMLPLAVGAVLASSPTRAQQAPVPANIPPPVVFAGPCVWAPVPPAAGPEATKNLTEVLIGSVIDRTLDGIGTALESAASERQFASIGSANVGSSQFADVRCLQFWSGPLLPAFGTPTQAQIDYAQQQTGLNADEVLLLLRGANPTDPQVARVQEASEIGEDAARSRLESVFPPPDLIAEVQQRTGLDAGEARRLLEAGIYPADRPSLFLEVWLRRGSDNGYMAIVPTLLIRNGSLETGRSVQPDRPLTIATTFLPVGGEKAISVQFGPRTFGSDRQRLLSTAQFSDPDCVTRVEKAEGGTDPDGHAVAGADNVDTQQVPACYPRGALETGWIVDPFAGGKPLSLTLSVSETRPRNRTLSFISGVFGDSREAIEAEVRQELIASEQAAADRAEAVSRGTAAVTAATSFTTSEQARRAFCAATADDLPARNLLAADFYAKQMLANEDARAAGTSPPYGILAVPGRAEEPATRVALCRGLPAVP